MEGVWYIRWYFAEVLRCLRPVCDTLFVCMPIKKYEQVQGKVGDLVICVHMLLPKAQVAGTAWRDRYHCLWGPAHYHLDYFTQKSTYAAWYQQELSHRYGAPAFEYFYGTDPIFPDWRGTGCGRFYEEGKPVPPEFDSSDSESSHN